MDSLKDYFSYIVYTRCGIPQITLEGTVDDWKKLRDRALGLAQYDLVWWVEALEPVLDQFVAAASGSVDQQFWSTMYKQINGSGGSYVTGWIITLFPYVGHSSSSLKRNYFLTSWQEHRRPLSGVLAAFPYRCCLYTPFKWLYFETEYPMCFYAGFMTVTQDHGSLAIRPEIGWAVADEKDETTKRQRRMKKFEDILQYAY